LAYKKIIQSAADRAKFIITVSDYSKRDIAKLLCQPAEKIFVIYEGANLRTDVSDAKLSAIKKTYMLKRPYFLFVGVLERKKNIVNLTRGFDAFIKKYGLDMDLVIAGKTDKHYPDIKHHALDIKAGDRLVFTGYVDDADLSALYKGAYAFVSASLHEGFGLPGAEATQFGLPLIVSNIAVFNEVYDNAAVYFNPLDPEDIAEKMHLVVKDTAFCEQLRQHSLKRGMLFDWKQTAEQTLGIYKTAIADKL
jgi:glycosyltransferase involved in cell wall biosynthesis